MAESAAEVFFCFVVLWQENRITGARRRRKYLICRKY
jgi:hypothetical protein